MIIRLLFIAVFLLTVAQACAQDSTSFKQLYVGFNGPSSPGRNVFASQAEATSSWLAAALGDRIPSVLAQVDFSHQLLIVTAVGERSTTTGNVAVSEVLRHGKGVMSFVRIGVNERHSLQGASRDILSVCSGGDRKARGIQSY